MYIDKYRNRRKAHMNKLWVTLAPDLKTLSRLSQERSCNDDLFSLLCPFVYLYYLGIPIDPLNLVFINIAIAAMHLQGLISAFHSYLTEGKFSRRILYGRRSQVQSSPFRVAFLSPVESPSALSSGPKGLQVERLTSLVGQRRG